MNTTPRSCFLQPLDVLVFRGNRLFGGPGAHGEALMPPWPSVFAGALRSQLLAATGTDLTAFASGQLADHVLGTPTAPRGMRVLGVNLARRSAQGQLQRLYRAPADVVVHAHADGRLQVACSRPVDLPLPGSAVLPKVAVLAAAAAKPEGGIFLDEAGWQRYLQGDAPKSEQLHRSSELWSSEIRTGVGLDTRRRAAADGQLFTSEVICFHHRDDAETGFAVDYDGLDDEHAALLHGTVRLGGEGRSATAMPATPAQTPIDPDQLLAAGRCRIVLTTPGLFADGWCPFALDQARRFEFQGLRGRLVCAAVARAETVSGWDLAKGCPKPAERVAPTGSVYWIEDLEGSADALGKLSTAGLWPQLDHTAARRFEGYNRFAFAHYASAPA